MINKLAEEVHRNAKNKGFHDNPPSIGESIALIHSEVSEALEADRVDKHCQIKGEVVVHLAIHAPTNEYFKREFKGHIKDTFEDELADIMIRVMDLAASKGIDLDAHIKAKMRYNSLREHMHGKKY